MRSVTKEQRKLCAKALLHYREHIHSLHTSKGVCSWQDFDDAYEAKHLAEQFAQETKGT